MRKSDFSRLNFCLQVASEMSRTRSKMFEDLENIDSLKFILIRLKFDFDNTKKWVHMENERQ